MDECSDDTAILTEMKALALSNYEVINTSETHLSLLCHEDDQNNIINHEEIDQILPYTTESINNNEVIESTLEDEDCFIDNNNGKMCHLNQDIVIDNETDTDNVVIVEKTDTDDDVIVKEIDIENIVIVNETDSEDVIFGKETNTENVVLVNETDTGDVAIIIESDTEYVAIVNVPESEGIAILNETDTEVVVIVNEPESEGIAILNETDTEDVAIVNETEYEGIAILNETDTEDVSIENETDNGNVSNVNKTDTDDADIVNEIDTKIDYVSKLENENEKDNLITNECFNELKNIENNAEIDNSNMKEVNLSILDISITDSNEINQSELKELDANKNDNDISPNQNSTPLITISVASSDNSIESLILPDKESQSKEEIEVTNKIDDIDNVSTIDIKTMEITVTLEESTSETLTSTDETFYSQDDEKIPTDDIEDSPTAFEIKTIDTSIEESSFQKSSDKITRAPSPNFSPRKGSVPSTPLTPIINEVVFQSQSKLKSKSFEDIDESTSRKKTNSFFEIDNLEGNITSVFNGFCTSSKTMSSSVMDSLIEVKTMLVKSVSKIGLGDYPNKENSSSIDEIDDVDSTDNEIDDTCIVIKTESVQSFRFSHIPQSYDLMLESDKDVDIYGFEQKEDFDKENYDKFMAEYLSILAHRSKRWQGLMDKKGNVRKSRKLKRFIRKGIPDEHRSMVWMYTSGAEFEMNRNPQLYQNLLDEPLDIHIVESIAKDVPRTFPDNIYFKDVPDPRAKRKCLTNVLHAVAQKHTNIGYCQGLNFVAGILLIVVKDEHKVFWLMDRLINMFPEYYTSNMIGLKMDQEVLANLIELKLPALHAQFERENITWMLISAKWFLCIYADVLPIETVLRIWDCLFCEGDKIIFRVALTMIFLYKDKILQFDSFPEIVTYCKNIPEDAAMLNCHEFIKKIFHEPGSLSRSVIRTLRKKYRQQIEDEER